MALVTYNSTLTEYENIIRTKLKVVNPTLIKSGALGILTNYLAGIKYDAFQLYAKTFQEMNVGLAQDFNSMLYHSTIYGTELEFAQPATLASSIVIPELRLAELSELVYTIPRFATFSDNNDLNFIYTSEIKMSITNKGMNATAWNPITGTSKLSVIKAPNPNVPGSNVFLIFNDVSKQYTRKFQEFIVTDHSVGESFEFSIGIDSVNNLKGTRVWKNTGTNLTTVQMSLLEDVDPDAIEGSFDEYGAIIEEVNLKFYKFDSSIFDDDIFLEIQDTSLNFETGDGLHGKLQAKETQLIVEVQETKGLQGNVANSEYIISDSFVQERYGSESPLGNPNPTTLNGLSTTGSYGGTNVQHVENIRQNIFNQINIRDSIITENDYERLFKYQGVAPFVDAKFVDAKAFVFLFNVIHDNDLVVPSMSINFKEEHLIEDPFYPLYDYNGVSLISPFYYKHQDPNTVDAYVVNPKVPFTLNETSISALNQSADYRVDIGLTYEFQRTQNSMNGTSFIEILGDIPDGYYYEFECSWLNGAVIRLNAGNSFKQEIDRMYTDAYCIVNDKTTEVIVRVYLETTSATNQYSAESVAEYSDTSEHHQLIKKQQFYKYFRPQEDEIINIPDTNTGYLDNFLENIFTEVCDVFQENIENQTESYLLRMPFIDEGWFFGKTTQEIFEILDSYFIVDYVGDNVNYNTQLTQAFHNTIDIPDKYYPWVFEKTTMPIISSPKLPISLELFLDRNQFITSPYQTQNDFEIALKIAVIQFMKTKEGFQIDFYETELEKMIYNEFSPLVINVKSLSPNLFQVNNAATLYNNIQENLPFDDLLDFIPPYFYYDYDIDLNITM